MFTIPTGVDWIYGDLFQRVWMMYFYGFGVLGVFGILALMVFRAYRLKDQLELDELECYLIKTSIYTHLITAGIALISILVLVFDGQPGYAGIVCFLMGPVLTNHGFIRGNQQEKIKQHLIENQQLETADNSK